VPENRHDRTTSARAQARERSRRRFLLDREREQYAAVFQECKNLLNNRQKLNAQQAVEAVTGFNYSRKRIAIADMRIAVLNLEQKLGDDPGSVTAAQQEELARLRRELDEWDQGEGHWFEKWYAQEEPGPAGTAAVAPVQLKGTVRQFGKWVHDGFESRLFDAESEWHALKLICPLFIQKDGKPLRARNIWQNLYNKKEEGKD
jgi:hypothetical protein